jgi:hypothetical protein
MGLQGTPASSGAPRESLRQERPRFHQYGEAKLLRSWTRRHGVDGFGEQRFEPLAGPIEPKLVNRVRAAPRLVLLPRLAAFRRVSGPIADVIRDLKGLAKTFAETRPKARISTGGKGAGGRRRCEQRARLGTVVVG